MAGIITTVAEDLAEYENEPMLAELFSEMLYELSEDRVRINSGDENETGRLFFLSEFRIKILSDYIRTTGPVNSLQEIANIPGFDRETAEMMAPFISFDRKSDINSESNSLRQSVLANIILKPVKDDAPTYMSAIKALMKYKFQSGNFSAGLTAERDPGEKIFYGNPPSPDFLSAFFAYKGTGIIKRIIAGDFSVKLGLGTAVNTNLRTGFSLTSPGNLSGKNEIRPYTSTDENNFFRGIAAVTGSKNLELSLFFSANTIDATLNEPGDSAGLSVKSLYTSGNHNTGISLTKKDVIKETLSGVNLSLDVKNLRTGITVCGSTFSLPFSPDKSDPRSLYDFRGRSSILCSFYYSTIFNKILLSGELSANDAEGYALVQTASFRPVDRMNISVLYRLYSPRYISFHGRGPGIGASNYGEDGIGGSITFEAARYLFISAGSDIRKIPWLGYRNSCPATSKRHEIRVKYLPSDFFNIEAQYAFRNTMKEGETEDGMPLQSESLTRSVRLAIKYSPSEVFGLTSRIDFKDASLSGSRGILLLQDMVLKFRNVPISIWMRYCIFNTGGFDSGIYTYENDLLNSFSIPVLYGKGTRNYLMVKWEPSHHAELRVKYGITSSSVENKPEEFRDEIRLQLNFRF